MVKSHKRLVYLMFEHMMHDLLDLKIVLLLVYVCGDSYWALSSHQISVFFRVTRSLAKVGSSRAYDQFSQTC